MRIQPVILAGGSGSRLWPLSRSLHPKQFLPLTDGEKSLLELTAERLQGMEKTNSPLVVCNENHRFMVAEQLHCDSAEPYGIILEPHARDTAAAVTLAALQATWKDGEDPVLLVMPADHLIRDTEAFQQTVLTAARVADEGALVTLGVRPDRPDTNYGYIRVDETPVAGQAAGVEAFVEKPSPEKAEEFLKAGHFFWNSGIFMFRGSVVLQELEQYAPEILGACRDSMKARALDGSFIRVEADAFAGSPAQSLDYAVLEHTHRASMLPLASDWSDVGAWSALWEVHDGHDPQGNVVHGDAMLQDVTGSYVRSESRLVSAVGVSDMVIVETADAVLVAPKNRVREVKQCVNRLKDGEREEARLHKRVFRPWGSYESLVLDPGFQVKRLEVKPGGRLSLQMHHHRAEHWTVVCGTARVTIGEREYDLEKDQSTYIPVGTRHRLENRMNAPLEVIEVQTGEYLGEDDIVRFDDQYGRVAG